MKRILLFGLSGLFLLMACEKKTSKSQNSFLVRLKQAQDTVDIFHSQILKDRVITNLNKYVRDNALTFSDWNFKVENITANQVNLKSTIAGDSSIYGVKFAIEIPTAESKIKTDVSKLKVGDLIEMNGEMAMATEDGRVSMNKYFASDSTNIIRLLPKEIKL